MLLHDKLMSPHGDVVMLTGNFVVGTAGAVGTVKGAGLASVTKESTAGQYSLVLDEAFNRLLFSAASVVSATFSGVQVIEAINDVQAAVQGKTAITIQCYDATGTAVNPASGSVISVVAMLRQSNVTRGGE